MKGNDKKKPLCVLQVRNSPLYGGVETTLIGWLDHIDRDMFSCPVALFNNKNGTENAFREPLEKRGHEVLDLAWGKRRNFILAIRDLLRLIRKHNAMLLHTHDWRSDVIGFFAARHAGIPIMTTIYVWFKTPFKVWISEWIDAIMIRFFDYVTAVCDATRRQTVDRGVAPEKTDVLISGISLSRDPGPVDRKAIRETFGIKADELSFVFVARFFPEKAHSVLVDAFKMALEKNNRLKLLLLGIGPLYDEIKKKRDLMGLTENILMPGFVTHVPAVLKSMDVMVHASLAEGISLAIYEGMLMGLPVIGSDVDGTPEVVLPGRTGWLVPPGNAEALSAAILDAAERPDLRKKFGAAGRQKITEGYNMKKAARKVEATYLKIIRTHTQKKGTKG